MYALSKLWNVCVDLKDLYSDLVDDFVDRLSCALSVMLLVVFFTLTSGKMTFGSPVECIFYAEHSAMKGSWISYYSDRCFIEGTYRFDYGNTSEIQNLHPKIDYEFGKMLYYMWNPFVLLCFALAFRVPKFFWDTCLELQPVYYRSVLNEAQNLNSLYGEKHQERLRATVGYIKEMCDVNCGSWTYGVMGAVSYVITKWLYVLNIAVQFYVLKRFVGNNSMSWGWDILLNGVFNRKQSTLFPFLSFCENDVKFHNDQQHIFQCVLPINLLNEKIYLFLWFWLVFLFTLALCSALYSTMIFFVPSMRKSYVISMMQISEVESDFDRRSMEHFVHQILFADGLLIFVMIKDSSGAIVASNMCRELWARTIHGRSVQMASRGFPKPPMSPSSMKIINGNLVRRCSESTTLPASSASSSSRVNSMFYEDKIYPRLHTSSLCGYI